ncbi:MAG: hypothetical protein GOVbin4206_44 [Prokaryotic dsDNA virus sp.]|mgnify:CR=1 FL=1|nr:MAG: hypothetical protein GOVbin4206_44 [Prokaryotic dsDNA virus sp.]|tara:strand:- start:4693 stop:4992 length:300 start_codon:yes stop_codon:yes gene_type:complete
MRKITREACHAFENAWAGNYKKSNTAVLRIDDIKAEMRLHGNLIAYSNADGIYISNGGWSSNTTKERLNGLTGVHIQQKDFTWYLNGEAWNGNWIRIGD